MQSNNNKKEEEVTEPGSKLVRIEHKFPPDLRTQFANHMVVQHTSSGDFYLMFFEVVPPVILGEQSEVDEQFRLLETTPANCVARVVISARQMPGIINGLSENHQKYLTRKAPSSTDDAEKRGGDKKHAS